MFVVGREKGGCGGTTTTQAIVTDFQRADIGPLRRDLGTADRPFESGWHLEKWLKGGFYSNDKAYHKERAVLN